VAAFDDGEIRDGDGEIRDGLLAVRLAGDEDRCVVVLEGEMDLSNTSVAEEALREATADAPGRIVIDMRELSFIDSTGIALLVRLLQEDQEAGRLRFLPSRFEEVTRVLRVTGIDEKLTPGDPLPS
jgi:anti-anti-sigma factor